MRKPDLGETLIIVVGAGSFYVNVVIPHKVFPYDFHMAYKAHSIMESRGVRESVRVRVRVRAHRGVSTCMRVTQCCGGDGDSGDSCRLGLLKSLPNFIMKVEV